MTRLIIRHDRFRISKQKIKDNSRSKTGVSRTDFNIMLDDSDDEQSINENDNDNEND